MSDRELLELAAKAAGLPLGYGEGEYFYCEHGPFGASMYGKQGNAPLNWNPLADDGDALRLALKLGVLLDVRYTDPAVQRHNRVTYWIDPAHGLHVQFDDFGTDLAAATRRAIVRAAAELGKAKP